MRASRQTPGPSTLGKVLLLLRETSRVSGKTVLSYKWSQPCPPLRASFCHANVKGQMKYQELKCSDLLSGQNPQIHILYLSQASNTGNYANEWRSQQTQDISHTQVAVGQVVQVEQTCGYEWGSKKWKEKSHCRQFLGFPSGPVNHTLHTLPAESISQGTFSKEPGAPLHIQRIK